MAESTIRTLSAQQAVDQIVETVERAEPGTAPFVLVLGSGFSQGLVPTVREVVTESLPLWMESINTNKPFDIVEEKPSAEKAEIARGFWKRLVEQNRGSDLSFSLDPSNGLPSDYAAAYKDAFSSRVLGAVGGPAQARRFQRDLVRLDQPRLNAAHFLLASILGVQPGRTRKSELFKAKAAFSRLILTTNFDPFLQTALQAVNRLYLMSDTPELGVSDEISDDQTDAIHLVYVHGSVHRRIQAASDAQIRTIKKQNARVLASALKRHGVIVLGYSGWEDVVVEALADCADFDHRLYWCGLEEDPLKEGAFGPRVGEILQKESAFYVHTAGAGPFMSQLCAKLVLRLPRLLHNPIGQLRELLGGIDFKELEDPSPPTAAETDVRLSGRGASAQAFVQAKESTLDRLKQAEQAFFNGSEEENGESGAESTPRSRATTDAQTAKVQQFLASANLAARIGNYQEALKLSDEGLALPALLISDRARFLLLRGGANYGNGNHDEAIKDWTRIVDEPGAPNSHMAAALCNRALVWGQKGEAEKAMADYTRVIEQLPGASVAEIAKALCNRGVAWGKKGDTEKELADCTRVIEQLPGAPVEQVARALNNRGVTWDRRGETERELADYTRVIEQLPGAPVEQVALALNNRGVTWAKKGDTERALADHTRVIEQLPGAPVEQLALALTNRGSDWSKKGELEKALADHTRAIEQLPGAPIEHVSRALYNRGVTWGMKGDLERELADYTRVIEQLPGAPAEHVAAALNGRGNVWRKKGDLERELADYTRVIELPGVSVEQICRALNNRAATWLRKGDSARELADYSRVADELPGAPVKEVARALSNRAVEWGKKGDSEKALADCTRLIEHFPGVPIERLAEALNCRGVEYDRKGETARALADYSRLIEELPEAPVEQVARALFNRALIWGKTGNSERVLADYTRLVELLPGAPIEIVASGLLKRAVERGRKGDSENALADYTRLIEHLPGAPVEEVVRAVANRAQLLDSLKR